MASEKEPRNLPGIGWVIYDETEHKLKPVYVCMGCNHPVTPPFGFITVSRIGRVPIHKDCLPENKVNGHLPHEPFTG